MLYDDSSAKFSVRTPPHIAAPKWGAGTSVPPTLSSFSGKLSPAPMRVLQSQFTGTRVDGGHYSIPESNTGRYSPAPSPCRRTVRTAEAPHVARKKKSRATEAEEKAAKNAPKIAKPRRNSLVAVQKQLRSDAEARMYPWQCAPGTKYRTPKHQEPVFARKLCRAKYDGYEPFVKTIEMRGLNGGECVARVRSDLASVGHIGGGSSKFYNWPTRPWYPPAVLRLQGYTQFKHNSEISHPRMAPVGHTRQRNGVEFLADTPIRTQHDRCIGTIEREIASAAVFRQDESMARDKLQRTQPLAPSPVGSPTGFGSTSNSWAVHSDALNDAPSISSGQKVRFFDQQQEQFGSSQKFSTQAGRSQSVPLRQHGHDYAAKDLEAAQASWEQHATRLPDLHPPALVALSQLLRLSEPDHDLLETGEWAVHACTQLSKLRSGQAMAGATLAQALAACYREHAHMLGAHIDPETMKNLGTGQSSSPQQDRTARNQAQIDALARAKVLDEHSIKLCDAGLCKQYFKSGKSISVMDIHD